MMIKKLIMFLGLFGSKNYTNVSSQIIYNKHKFFTCALPATCLEEVDKYLPSDLLAEDAAKIEQFINNYKDQQEVQFIFYKDEDVTRLQKIVVGDNVHTIQQSKPNKTSVNGNLIINFNSNKKEQQKESGPSLNNHKISMNSKLVINCNSNNIKVALISNIGIISEIKEILKIWEIIKLYYATHLDIDTQSASNKIVQFIFRPSSHLTPQLIGVKVIDQIRSRDNPNRILLRKKNFYIIYVGNKKLCIDEQGYLIPGEILHITNRMPIKNAFNNLGSKFGYRMHPILRKRKFHAGQDIRAPIGTEIYSMGDGIVVFSGYNRTYGYVVVVYHGKNINEGYSTLYAHCSKLLVKKGMRVKKWQLIGLVGSTGRSSGPHLHFEVINNKTKQRLNPVLTYNLSTKMIPPFLIKDFVKRKQEVEKILREN